MVLFYKSFSSGYSYTDIAKITNPEGLADAVGQESVSVTFRSVQAAAENENNDPVITDNTEDKKRN